MKLGQDEFRALQRSADMHTAEQESAPQTPTYVLQEACPDDDFPQEACPDEALIFSMEHVSQQTVLSEHKAKPPSGVPGKRVVNQRRKPGGIGRKPLSEKFLDIPFDKRFNIWLENFKTMLRPGKRRPGEIETGWAIRFERQDLRPDCDLNGLCGFDVEAQMQEASNFYREGTFGFYSSRPEALERDCRWSNQPTIDEKGQGRSRVKDLQVKELKANLTEITKKIDNTTLERHIAMALFCLGLRVDVGIPDGDNTPRVHQVATDAYLIHLASKVPPKIKPTGP